MIIDQFKNHGAVAIAGLLFLITILSLLLRITPVFLGNPDVLSNVEMDDPTYQLRRVELSIANFPQFEWFDPMTFFPGGQPIHWGPLFPLMSSAICILTGAHSRPEIIQVCLLIPCIMGALLVPVVFLIARRIADWKAGLIAGFCIAICPGQFFFRSFYGYFDHHIGEVLFSTIFCLLYLTALAYCRKNPVHISDTRTWKTPAILGLLCGVSYVIGLALMPTMILFALLVGIFTPAWFIVQKYHRDPGTCVVIVNSTTFLVAIIGFFLIGVHGTEGLNYYTLGHPLAYGLIILTTLILFAISRYLHDHSLFQYILALAGVSVIALALFALSCPDMFQYLVSNANAFFGQSIHWKTIREAKPWTFEDAWHTFQYGLILFAIGIAILLNRIRKDINPSDLFILIWSVVVLYATMQHIRYEYYLAIPLAILGGIALASAIQYVRIPGCFHTNRSADIRKKEVTRKRHEHTHQHAGSGTLLSSGGLYFCCLLLLGVLFTYNSLGVDLAFGPLHLNPDWRESMEWMNLNTPDPGVDYLKIYQEEQWQPPAESYGVMSWWDYGHMITYIAKRMPNANPFQKGVDGDFGAARFFITSNESESSGILDNRKTRYIITDYLMDVSIFWAMATWNNPDTGLSPYQRSFIIPHENNPNSGQNYSFFMEPYYQTMVSRLHNFDGSMKNPDQVFYINYLNPPYSGTTEPVIVNGSELPYNEASALIKNSTLGNDPRYGAALVNYVYTSPVSLVPALQHYRLVHESPTRASPQELPDIRYVKIFEYVPGAVITGDGIIEITVRTNTGREFVYRQESVNGSFTVPYPTQSRIGDVETLGLYRIVETGKEFQVTDEQILNGDMVSKII